LLLQYEYCRVFLHSNIWVGGDGYQVNLRKDIHSNLEFYNSDADLSIDKSSRINEFLK